MKKEKKSNALNQMLVIVGGVALMVAGFIIIPPLLNKCSNKIYKNSLRKEKIDFDNMGPEIVPHDKTEGEK